MLRELDLKIRKASPAIITGLILLLISIAGLTLGVATASAADFTYAAGTDALVGLGGDGGYQYIASADRGSGGIYGANYGHYLTEIRTQIKNPSANTCTINASGSNGVYEDWVMVGGSWVHSDDANINLSWAPGETKEIVTYWTTNSTVTLSSIERYAPGVVAYTVSGTGCSYSTFRIMGISGSSGYGGSGTALGFGITSETYPDINISINGSFADTTPPVISAVDVTEAPRNALFTWTTDEGSESRVCIGSSTISQTDGVCTAGSVGMFQDTDLVTSHSMDMVGSLLEDALAPATQYHYRVCSKDASDNAACSSDATFTTTTPTNNSADPTVTIWTPEAGAITQTEANYPTTIFSAVSDQDIYYDEEVTFDMRIRQDSVVVWSENDMESNLVHDNQYAVFRFHPMNFQAGESYDISARACFQPHDCGDWSADVTIDVGGSTAPGIPEIIAGLPSHDDQYGDCDILTWSAGQSGACLWTWISYAFLPPDNATFQVATPLLNTIETRWPFIYFTNFISAFNTAITSEATCPVPEILGGEFMDTALPTIDTCDWFDPIPDAITANATLVSYLNIGLWLAFVGFSLGAVREFFK